MHGMKIEKKGDKVVIEIDVSPQALKNARLSKSKRAQLPASTEGWAKVDGLEGMAISLNAAYKAPK